MDISRPKLKRGIRFNSADPALNAAVEGAGVLLASNILAYDDLRTGRLVSPIPQTISPNRGFYLVHPKSSVDRKTVIAFQNWIEAEFENLDGRVLAGLT